MAKQKDTQAVEKPVKKTSCPITRKQFSEKAAPVKVALDFGKGAIPYVAASKQFSTGSMGWNINDKTFVEIDGVPTKVQIGMNITVVGSKELA